MYGYFGNNSFIKNFFVNANPLTTFNA